MARTANPFTPIAKKLANLREKMKKLDAEINGIATLVAQESRKVGAPKAKKTAAPKGAAKKTKKVKKVAKRTRTAK